MKFYRIVFSLFMFAVLATSCGDDDQKSLDFRDRLVGTYDCTKYNSTDLDDMFSSEAEIVVTKDPDNDNNLIINGFSIPVDEEGSYGPDLINANMNLELRFDGDKIDFRMQPHLVIGLALPCIFIGEKR